MFLQLSNTENLDFNKGVLKRTAFYITETCPFNIQRFLFSDLKIENYIGKCFDNFLIFAQNRYTPAYPSFTIQKWCLRGLKGVFIARTCFPDEHQLLLQTVRYCHYASLTLKQHKVKSINVLFIRKACPCIEYPLKPDFYIVKHGEAVLTCTHNLCFGLILHTPGPEYLHN